MQRPVMVITPEGFMQTGRKACTMWNGCWNMEKAYRKRVGGERDTDTSGRGIVYFFAE